VTPDANLLIFMCRIAVAVALLPITFWIALKLV